MLSVQLILVLIIIAAIAAVEARNLLSSVIAVGTVGLGLSTCFLLLHAPDLAIILLVIEILTLTALLRVTSISHELKTDRSDLLTTLTALVFAALFLFGGLRALREIPPFASPAAKLTPAAEQGSVALTGAVNVVSSVGLGFRAYDAFIGIFVLFLVAVGLTHILERKRPE